MLGELVVEIVGRIIIGVVWRGFLLVLRGLYRAVTFPFRLVARGGLSAADGDEGARATPADDKPAAEAAPPDDHGRPATEEP